MMAANRAGAKAPKVRKQGGSREAAAAGIGTPPPNFDPLDMAQWEDLERGRQRMEEIRGRLEKAANEIDWMEEADNLEAEARENNQTTGEEEGSQDNESGFIGHDMHPDKQVGKVGCRLMTINSNKQSTQEDEEGNYQFAREIDEILQLKVDIAVIHEPGNTSKIEGRLKLVANEKGCTAIIKSEGAAQSEGTIVVLTQAWRMIKETEEVIQGPGFSPARVVRVTFKQARKQKGPDGTLLPLEHFAVFSVYGYADKSRKVESITMWKAVVEKVNKWRADNRMGSVIVMGDLNATISTMLDTDNDKCTDPEKTEHDAGTLRSLAEDGLGLIDLFRELHPKTRAVTRIKEGEIARRLDSMWVTKELANHPMTRIGISEEMHMGSDHRVVIADLPIDCAGLAEGTTPIWSPHSVKKLTILPEAEVSDEAKEAFTAKFVGESQDMGNKTLDEAGAAMLANLYSAASETIAVEKTMRYPKKVSHTPYSEGWGVVLDTWKKRMTGARWSLKSKDRTKIRKALQAARWKYPDIPTGISIDKMTGLWEEWDTGNRETTRQRLTEQILEVTAQRKLCFLPGNFETRT